MATITQELHVYFRPSWTYMDFPYVLTHVDMDGEDDYVFVSKTTLSFENNIDTRAEKIDFLEKKIKAINAEHYAKKNQLQNQLNELLAIGHDGCANPADAADEDDEVQF